MRRRGAELVEVPSPPRKKLKAIEDPPPVVSPSLDTSFQDDEALPPGIVFTDLQQKKWKIGKPIGRGSFGRIYLASDNVEGEVTKLNARYVVKIEPHSNGPLFVEIHCLIRTAQAAQVKSWRTQHKQKSLGMPVYIASGSFIDDNTSIKYRFLVLPRYDIDLHKVIAKTKVLDLKNVLVLAIQILDVLEYLHNEGYTHSDIKSSNLMLGYGGGKVDKVPTGKLTASYQKDFKEIPGKDRRVRANKQKNANYYVDEDFIIKDYKSPSHSDDDNEKKMRKLLTDKDNRTLHRNNVFNLRQLSNYANYEDVSSIASDQSYQKNLDDFGNKNLIQTTKEFQKQKSKARSDKIEKGDNETENNVNVYNEAVLSQSNGQIYLLDYGLASKFIDSRGDHKAFGMDARKAHDGTLEYSSRDSHIGAHSRRSDLETLGYNILDWLTGMLPWKSAEVLTEPDLVHALKKKYMSDIKLLLKVCFKTEFYPQFIEKYLQYVTSLDFTEKPDYDYCRSLFSSELYKTGNKEVSLNLMETVMSMKSLGRGKLSFGRRFGRKKAPPNFLALKGMTKVYERENVCSLEHDLKLELLRQTLNTSSEGIRKPCVSRNFFVSDADLVARLKKSLMPHGVLGKKLSPKNLRSKNKIMQRRRGVRRNRNSIGKFGNFMGSARQFTWAEILAGNPEDIIRKERNNAADDDDDDDDTCKYRIRKVSNASSECSDSEPPSPLLQKDYLKNMNPTYAMNEVINLLKKNVSKKTTKETEDNPPGFEGYTPAMIKVYKMKEKREAKEKLEALKLANRAKLDNDGQKTQQKVTRSSKNKTGPVPQNKATESISSDELKKTETKPPPHSDVPRQSSRLAKQKASTQTIDKETKAPRNTKNQNTTKSSLDSLEKACVGTESKKSTSPRNKQKASSDSIDSKQVTRTTGKQKGANAEKPEEAKTVSQRITRQKANSTEQNEEVPKKTRTRIKQTPTEKIIVTPETSQPPRITRQNKNVSQNPSLNVAYKKNVGRTSKAKPVVKVMLTALDSKVADKQIRNKTKSTAAPEGRCLRSRK